MARQTQHKFACGVFVGVLIILLLVLTLGVGMKLAALRKDTAEQDGKTNVDFSHLSYAALGDSITYGADYERGYAAMDVPYCMEVKSLLGLSRVQNYGISSTCLSDIRGEYGVMSRRYVNMADDFDIVSVLGGVNDFNSGAPLGNINSNGYDSIYGSLNILAKGLKEKYPNAFIFFMTPLSESSKWYAENHAYSLLDVGSAVKEVCAKYDIAVLDTAVLADYAREYNAPGYTGDGLHPSQEFHKTVLAPVIADFIRKNYKPAEAI